MFLKLRKYLNWPFRVLLFAGFALASVGKLTSGAGVIALFRHWGYPDGFYLLVGVYELVVAVLLLIPRTCYYAAYGLFALMTAACITHILSDPLPELIRPVIFMVLLTGVILFNKSK